MKTINHESQVYGCWMGKSIGGTLGLPAEGRTQRQSYSFYDPVPTMAPPNDDLELQLVWLEMIERGGSKLSRNDFAKAWLKNIHYMWDEYGRCRWNLRRGVPLDINGIYENPFHAGMGSPIRSEIWASLFPDDPSSAGYYAALDASLDHGNEGIAGEVLCAVIQSCVYGGASVQEAIRHALSCIPTHTETAAAVYKVIASYDLGLDVWECRKMLLSRHRDENFTHAPLNVALCVWALLYGAGDFETSILLAVNAGYDTDSTAATVGATLGIALGIDDLPSRWSEPIGDGVHLGPGILDLENPPLTLDALTQRVGAGIGKLARKDITQWNWKEPTIGSMDLPGAVRMRLKHGQAEARWSNGEIPASVKEAGGATWEWHVEARSPRSIICLAREGARLFIDDTLVLECPPGLPYVPATHRCPKKAYVAIQAAEGSHEVRLELNLSREDQCATVLLAYPNNHICPWTRNELPHLATLLPVGASRDT